MSERNKDFEAFAKSAGISSEQLDRLESAFGFMDDVERGERERPGGALCMFPDCCCNKPWEKCEQKGKVTG